MNQEMMNHVHSNSSNLLALTYPSSEHSGNLTIDLGASSNTQNSTNLTNTSNSPSNDKSSANNHLSHNHHNSQLHHSSNQLNHHHYNPVHQAHHHQSILNANNVSIFSANHCENHNLLAHQHGSPIMDLNSSYNQANGAVTRNGQVGSSTSANNNRLTPNSDESSGTQSTVHIKTEPNNTVSVYSLSNGEEYIQNDSQLNCNTSAAATDAYRTDIVKLENTDNCSVGNSLNNVTLSYSTSGYNGYDQLQMGNLSTQLILHPSSSSLIGSTTHLQNALNNHGLHHPQSNLHLVASSPSISGLHSVIVENDSAHTNQHSPTSKNNGSNGENVSSNYNLTLMTAAAVTNTLQQQPLLQVTNANDLFGLPPSKRSRRSAQSSNNNFTNLHPMDLEDTDHLHQSTLNAQQQQSLHNQHQIHQSQQLQPITTTNSQMSVDFNLCSDNQPYDEYTNYIYIPKLN